MCVPVGEYEAYGEKECGHETGPRDQGQVVLRLARLQVRQSTTVIALIRVFFLENTQISFL